MQEQVAAALEPQVRTRSSPSGVSLEDPTKATRERPSVKPRRASVGATSGVPVDSRPVCGSSARTTNWPQLEPATSAIQTPSTWPSLDQRTCQSATPVPLKVEPGSSGDRTAGRSAVAEGAALGCGLSDLGPPLAPGLTSASVLAGGEMTGDLPVVDSPGDASLGDPSSSGLANPGAPIDAGAGLAASDGLADSDALAD